MAWYTLHGLVQIFPCKLGTETDIIHLVEAHWYGMGRAEQLLSNYLAVETDWNVKCFHHESLHQLQCWHAQHCNWRRPSQSKRFTFQSVSTAMWLLNSCSALGTDMLVYYPLELQCQQGKCKKGALHSIELYRMLFLVLDSQTLSWNKNSWLLFIPSMMGKTIFSMVTTRFQEISFLWGFTIP